ITAAADAILVEGQSKAPDIAPRAKAEASGAGEPKRPTEETPNARRLAEADALLERDDKPEPQDPEQSQKAADRSAFNAAKQLVTRGEAALAERRYADAAALFDEAVALLKDRHPVHLAIALEVIAEAFYRQGREQSDKALLNRSI